MINSKTISPIPPNCFTIPEEGWVMFSYWCISCEKLVGFHHMLNENNELEVFDTFTMSPHGVEYAKSLSERSTVEYFVDEGD